MSDRDFSRLNDPPIAAASAIVARRLRRHSVVGERAVQALHSVLGVPVKFAAGVLVAQTGDAPDLMTIVQKGVAGRSSILPNGRRQIHSLFLPGETADAEIALFDVRPDNLEILTPCTLWLAPMKRMAALLRSEPELTEAFAREAAIASQVAREWVVSLGQRTALQRIAHLICELDARFGALGLVEADTFIQPLTQQTLADAQGLSTVHVNRVLQDLRDRNLICVERRRLTILDRDRLQRLALFDGRYLYLTPLAA